MKIDLEEFARLDAGSLTEAFKAALAAAIQQHFPKGDFDALVLWERILSDAATKAVLSRLRDAERMEGALREALAALEGVRESLVDDMGFRPPPTLDAVLKSARAALPTKEAS